MHTEEKPICSDNLGVQKEIILRKGGSPLSGKCCGGRYLPLLHMGRCSS